MTLRPLAGVWFPPTNQRWIRVAMIAIAFAALARTSWATCPDFAAAVPYTAGTSPQSVAIGDFNGDGRADLAVANPGSNNLSILLGNGNGTFAGPTNYAFLTGPLSVSIGDFNGDGKADLAVTGGPTQNKVSILLGNGNGTFAAAVNYDAGSRPYSVAIGDFNGDGKPDLAFASYASSAVSILLGNGDGTFAAAVNYAVGNPPFNIPSIAAGDLNGDGKIDIAVVNRGGDDVWILQGNGNGTFALPANPVGGDGIFAGPVSVSIGDFNSDGKLDLAVANYFSNNVSILLGNGDSTFAAAITYGAGTNPYSVAVGDFNGDGKPDVAVANNGSNNVTILLNTGVCSMNCATFAAALNYGTGSFPGSVAIGDVNGDGKLDLAVANESSNNVSILLGNGNGTFAPKVDYGAGTSPDSVAIGDFNGDGKPDLAVANSGSGNVSILLGNGNGTFAPAAGGPVSAGSNPSSVTIGDFNADGRTDLAVANLGFPGPGSLSILLGNGNGTFAAAAGSPVSAGTGPFSVAIGDFNGDGKPDLAVANRDSEDVSILLGNGNGTFAAAAGSPASANGSPDSVTIGDFNGDGKPDLAVATGAGGLFILLGNGNGTFAAAPGSPVSAGSNPNSVAIGDFNGDGKPDLVVANTTSNNVVSILLNTCPRPDLTVAKTHLGNFSQGDTGTYTITVFNIGGGATTGTVTISDTLPVGLTARAISGTGWTCDLGTVICTRSDAVPAGSTYEDVTLTVNVAVIAPAMVSNSATVSGGGELNTANNTATDPTTINHPDLTVSKTHTGNFTQGQTGATYTITVNNIGAAPTTASVSVSDTLPAGLTATAISGMGWSCNLGVLSCNRGDVLAGASSYPTITLTVNVNSNAGSSVINGAAVSGGGEIITGNDTASDPTTVNPTSGLIPPTNLLASATSTSQISVTWNAVTGAATYRVFRSSSNGPYALVGSPATSAFPDSGLSANTTYLYQVRAVDGLSNVGPVSNNDLATTIIFTDDPLVAGSTVIKTVHLTELRTAVNAVRAAAGLSAATFTDPSPAGVFIKLVHITELRSNLDPARVAIGVPALVYTDPALAAGNTVKAAHIQELRNGVK